MENNLKINSKPSDVDILNLIKQAIDNDGFEMYYQPIYSTKDGKFISAEALIRLKNTKDYGYISPEIFIPIAEKNGYAEIIGNIVFDKVCKFYKESVLENKGVECIEVNISALHITSDSIVKDFTNTIKKYNLRAEAFNIEITETADIKDQNAATKNLNSLRSIGFKFSMDDFGTGYSSILNIVTNRYEQIKIDKSILWKATKNDVDKEDSQTLLNACISLGHSLGRKVVVEGVETEEMVKYLEKHNVEFLQGYYFSEPQAENDFVNFLIKNNIKTD